MINENTFISIEKRTNDTNLKYISIEMPYFKPMKKKIDLSNWPRKGHYNFFKEFDEPFFGITTEINCTGAFQYCKSTGTSFFLYYLHKSLVAIHQTEDFRYRIEGENVFLYDEIKASATIGRPDGTFGFSSITYDKDFDKFASNAKIEIERVQQSNDVNPSASNNLIHYSSVPWIRFTSLTHARKYNGLDSVPKISFGKLTEENNKHVMPVSVFAHHALMDGYHVGEHFRMFEELMSTSHKL